MRVSKERMLTEKVRTHYEEYPYPRYPLMSSVRKADTYALNLKALWSYFNHTLPPPSVRRILIAGCGTFSPYPFSVANPDTEIVALDLSQRSLKRARLHCLMHGIRNVRFEAGDLCDPVCADGLFGLIDAFGVLHHLDNPLSGLRALEQRLAPGGMIRLMLYSRYARRDEESIRRALRVLKIEDIAGVKKIIRRSAKDSRLRRYADTSYDAEYDSGLADALLHPCVHTYKIDELLELVERAELVPLRFAHQASLTDPAAEIERIRELERQRCSPGNFVVYLGRNQSGLSQGNGSHLLLNPCLTGSVGRFCLGELEIAPRMGSDNPQITAEVRSFLRSFIKPVTTDSLSDMLKNKLMLYREALFLLQYNE